jgi:hypothetical protein
MTPLSSFGLGRHAMTILSFFGQRRFIQLLVVIFIIAILIGLMVSSV